MIKISKHTYPQAYVQLYENQENYNKLSYHLLAFIKKMYSEKGIIMAALLLGDQLLIAERGWLSFQEFCTEIGLSIDFNTICQSN